MTFTLLSAFMHENGVVHDVLYNDVTGKIFHLELRCVPCPIKTADDLTVTTRSWLTTELLNEALDLLAIASNKRLTNPEEKPKAEVVEGPNLRMACVFKPDPWATNRQKVVIIPTNDKEYLAGEQIIASIALKGIHDHVLMREMGLSSLARDNTISKYFQKDAPSNDNPTDTQTNSCI